MKTPEEIALIGGGILLSSGLVFGLKSGAASELPNVSRSVDTALLGKKNADSSSSSSSDSANSANQAAAQKQQQQEQAQQQAAQKQQAFENSFDGKYQQAQQKGWQTGNWGSAKFYVDNNENMHVGSGQLQGSFAKLVGQQISTINLDEPVQAPSDSSYLFSDPNYNDEYLTNINGLTNLDTSQTTNMDYMFEDENITSLDLSHFNTSNVQNMEFMFEGDNSLSSLDLSHFDTHNVTNMDSMFYEDSNLTNLNISLFDTSKVTDMMRMFANNQSLTSLDVSHFDTHNVKSIREMFEDDNMHTLDLSNFDTSNVSDTWSMFDSSNIHQLILGNNSKLFITHNAINDDGVHLSGTYKNGNQTLNGDIINDGQAHPGTWYKQ